MGVSNYTPAQVNVLSAFWKAPIAAHQVEFSLLETAPLFNGVLDQTMEQKIPLYAWSPLAGGVVSQNTRIMTVLNDMAQQKGCTPAALALAFILRHPASITPIIGTKDPAHFREAMSALNITLTRAEWYSLLETSLGRRMP